MVFNFHGYPWLIHRLTYRRPGQHNIHVRGYKEQGNIDTPLELPSAIRPIASASPSMRSTGCRVSASQAPSAREALLNQQIACKEHAYEFGIDRPEITDWQWPF